MAEFTEVWNEWKRMCKHEQLSASCRTCPLYDLECDSEHPKDQNHYDGHAIEEIIMGWAEAHGEPVYPTWWEFFNTLWSIDTLQNDASNATLYGFMSKRHIPADIAEKLGIEPKYGA